MRKLYFSPWSPYTRKVRVMLAEKRLEFTLEKILTDRFDAGYAASVNPCGRVPALDDDGFVLFESNVILDYLLTKYPQTPPTPGHPPLTTSLLRADKRWEDTEALVAIETMLNSGLTMLRFGTLSGVDREPAYLVRERARVDAILDWLEKRATPEGFVPGWFSVLDLNLVVTLQWLDFRKLHQWRGRPAIDRLVAFHERRPTFPPTHPTAPL